MANEDRRGKPITQKTFVSLLKKHYFVKNNFVAKDYEIDRQNRILMGYWEAITSIIGKEDSVLFGSIGVQLFLMFCPRFFETMKHKYNSFHVDKMKEELRKCFEDAGGEAIGVGTADFWKSGGRAGGLNSGAVSKVSQRLYDALHRSIDLEDDV